MKVLTSLTYVAFRAGERLACVLPPRAVPWVARVGGAVAVAVMPGRRRMVARHLRRVHAAQFGQGDQGHLEGRALSRSVRATFRSYASYWLDTFRMCRLDPVALDATVEGRGLELVDRALQNGRGAVLATAHLGSWDLGGAWLAGRGYPLTAVVERLRPPRLLNWFVDVRRRLGMEVIVRGPDVWERLEQALQSNHLVVLVSDRDLGGRGVAVRFFGEETTLPRGPARLARRCGSLLLPVAVYARGGGRHLGVVRPPVAVVCSDDEEADVAQTSQRLAGELEKLIGAAPEQWHLMHPNWPSDHTVAS